MIDFPYVSVCFTFVYETMYKAYLHYEAQLCGRSMLLLLV